MAVKVNMPKLSDTMEEGVLQKWNVKEGDQVKSGDVVAEVETDKATMEVEVFDSGTILKILVDEGDTVPLGETMAIIGEEGEEVEEEETADGKGETAEEDEAEQKEAEDRRSETGESGAEEEQESEGVKREARSEKREAGGQKTEAKEEAGQEAKGEEGDTADGKRQTADGKQQTAEEANGRIKASPLAKRMAEEQGIDLSKVNGSGPEGRIIKSDIENYEPAEAEGAVSPREDTERNISQMRKTIAGRLSESKYSSPHFYETIEIDAEALFGARERLNEAIDDSISFGNIIVKACAMALRKHPQVNSSWKEDHILEHGDVSVAFAVAVDQGLLTPVIRNTDQKGLQEIAAESKKLIELSRSKKLQPEQMEGSTFTISNLGMFGIDEFTAIINPPNACILAVGSIREVPVVENGEIVPGKRMKVTLSSDHRIVDGATAAQFLSTLRTMLENPLGMLL